MKKLLLTLAAGAALAIGLAGHAAPASALPVGESHCAGHTIPDGFYVDLLEDGSREVDTCRL
jgi:hypothetical protein